MTTDSERLAVLETEFRLFKEKQDELNKKLDDLLAIRHKGMGAFWLASTLIGTGIIGFMASLISWIKP